MGVNVQEMLPAPSTLVQPLVPTHNGQPVYSLYHIPPTLSTFTVEYLSKLFSAVEKPPTVLKRPDRPIDSRKYPEFR
ncbi:hypothetical protein LPJ58_007116, partial [Coemansia sp. RSA 1591]